MHAVANAVSAAGKTPEELARDLDRLYSKLLTKPRSTVSLVRYGQRIRDLKEAIRTATRGQSRLTVVGPDGRITLPLIEPIFVAGKTIDEAQRAITAAYARVISGLNVSTLLLKATGNRAYVFGYVGRPNYVELIGPTTVTQAIAMAGGLDPRAEARTVLLITRDEANHPVGRVIDLNAILTTGNLGKDPILRQGDVIYVPNTRLADA
ncbi:MAG TPA: polysaccharide biosynthesis/export family protein, partial [Hydrogenophilus thermoluteolus]|nr:polysaccharide biosynthesis/export family protein [Hydrogenophilus thermoluteolus]